MQRPFSKRYGAFLIVLIT